jgi:hypothetical protein
LKWNPASDGEAQSDIIQVVQSHVPKTVPEMVTQYPDGGERISGALYTSSDGRVHHCWGILVCELSDHMEHAKLMGVGAGFGPMACVAFDLQFQARGQWLGTVIGCHQCP